MRHVIGCMSGTSMDAVDAASVRVDGVGLDLTAEFVALESEPLGALGDSLRTFSRGDASSARDVASLARAFSRTHARLVERLADAHGPADLVCAHGQTVHHADGLTWQLFDPWPLATSARCPVVFDLRRADVTEGGDGAPITPLADWVLFRDSAERRAIVNLGGFCNVTILPAGEGPQSVRGFDLCACNQILDEASRRVLNQPFDQDGAAAAAGEIHADSRAHLVDILYAQWDEGRSLGTGDESWAWLDRWQSELAPNDLVATATSAVGSTIAQGVLNADRVLLAGGGAMNPTLVRAIESATKKPTGRTDDFGVPAQAREAVAMAILGAMCADGVSITLPGVTKRASARLLDGAWVNARIAT